MPPMPRCVRRSIGLIAVLAATVSIGGSSALAWSNHSLMTWPAVAQMPEIAGRDVRAEPLAEFLMREAQPLEAALEAEERWARSQVSSYPARPDNLRFRRPGAGGGDGDAGIVAAFLQAIRVNRSMPLGLFLQRRPGVAVPPGRLLDWQAVAIRKNLLDDIDGAFERLDRGQMVAAADVVATASNEPDFGLDLGLWQDNGTPEAALYGFGPQPFGNPAIDYSSQAPFHMGFYHESRILYAAAPSLSRCYPEARIHLFLTLARFAFDRGHSYWGWRFAGWAAHYVQDLSQPYHSRALPGVSVARTLWVSLTDMAGWSDARRDAIALVTNRHIVLENYQSRHMAAAFRRSDWADPLLSALADVSGDPSLWRLGPSSVRDAVAGPSADAADALDALLRVSFPDRYVADPAVVLDDTRSLDLERVAAELPAVRRGVLEAAVADRLRQLGRDTRALIRTAVSGDGVPPHEAGVAGVTVKE